ncbi:hypothetical protein AM10699_43260 [Acaryochloris marina MBIC10699]|nr:hypothetical protein AM10699_43260 [Acaryochloris marina MBIC10699]
MESPINCASSLSPNRSPGFPHRPGFALLNAALWSLQEGATEAVTVDAKIEIRQNAASIVLKVTASPYGAALVYPATPNIFPKQNLSNLEARDGG